MTKKYQILSAFFAFLFVLSIVDRKLELTHQARDYLRSLRPAKDYYSLQTKLAQLPEVTDYKHFVVVVTSYNNAAYAEKNLTSIFEQKYPNFRVIYVDDCSTDATFKVVKAMIQKYNMQDRVTIVRNETRKRKMENIYNAFSSCLDHEIIMECDGDDWLSHHLVLDRINQFYQNKDIWATYGTAIECPSYKVYQGKPLKDWFWKLDKIRIHNEFPFTMPRTFYASLFKKLRKSDFLKDGKYLPMASDTAYYYGIAELARGHVVYIEDVAYIVNRLNPINDSKVNLALQVEIDDYICSLPPYAPLESSAVGNE